MLDPIKKISATKIIKETGTKGNSPLLVSCDDFKRYYVKTTTPQIPRVELINEIICSYLLKVWGLNVPDISLVKIEKEVVDAYVKEEGPLSNRYNSSSFDDFFVGFEEVSPALELDQYIDGLSSKHEWNEFNNPIDLLKIGIFDTWVCNMDRKPDNPNILLYDDNSGFDFVPIDNAASFAYSSNYKNLNKAILHLQENKMILNIPVVSSIVKFVPKTEIQTLDKLVLQSISDCCNQMDDIFNQVPNNWGFSKKARLNLKNILGDKERNVVTSKRYFPYTKK